MTAKAPAKIDRRTALAVTGGGLASALAGMTAYPATATEAATDADAELIRLGAELDRAMATYEKLDAERTRLYKVCEPLLVQDADGALHRSQQDAFFAAADATGYSKASEASTAGWDRIDALSKQIQSLPAVTLAGFAVKATALEWEMIYAFPELEDATDIAFRQFVAALRQAGGVS